MESDAWKTALLLEQHITEHREQNIEFHAWAPVPGRDWELCFAEPDTGHAGRFLVTYWDPGPDEVIILPLTAGHGTPKDKARTMAAFLQVTPADRWPVTKRAQRTRR